MFQLDALVFPKISFLSSDVVSKECPQHRPRNLCIQEFYLTAGRSTNTHTYLCDHNLLGAKVRQINRWDGSDNTRAAANTAAHISSSSTLSVKLSRLALFIIFYVKEELVSLVSFLQGHINCLLYRLSNIGG